MRDFYTTLAQVLPFLILAICWDSKYLDRLRDQDREGKKPGTNRGYFWRKSRVRIFGILVCSTTIAEIAVVFLVLVGAIADSAALRVVLLLGLFLVLGTLLTRLCVDVGDATRRGKRGPEAAPVPPPLPPAGDGDTDQAERAADESVHRGNLGQQQPGQQH
ncbi:hypothetical protein [Amycolatopsis sp. NPDC021455]|uniref:hypothetical protein n=1 Tax=Amycolatopsis sp. NPDC021455 TaxID=3154901 RepID=UPI0033FA9893